MAQEVVHTAIRPVAREARRQWSASHGRRRDAARAGGRARSAAALEDIGEWVRQDRTRAIDRGLAGDGSRFPLARSVAAAAAGLDEPNVKALRRLLYELRDRASPLLNDADVVGALGRLAAVHRQWERTPAKWEGARGGAHMQLHGLACHLLCGYPPPFPFAGAWLFDTEYSRLARGWFLHVGAGHNLRTAPGLPFPLTRWMAHNVLLAPDHLSFLQALRWGQFVGVGVPEWLAEAAAASELGRPWPDESLCLSLGRFLARHAGLAPGRVRPIVDYVVARRFGGAGLAAQPQYNMDGRTPASVEREMEAWHRSLHRATLGLDRAWTSCGIGGMEPTEVAGAGAEGVRRTWSVIELTDAEALHAEGTAMHHCVFGYANWAATGRCAIFSVRADDGDGPLRCVTVEVRLPERQIVQARGHCNAAPRPDAWRALLHWAQMRFITVAPGCR